jgi:ABC-2 type transport system ATP-binding protein
MQLVFPTTGVAEILGKPIGDPETKRRIGYLPENPYFYDYLSAEELLTYFAGLFGYRAADRATRAKALLDEVGIGAERRMPLRKYSKGMVQRVGIAQALINDPDVVFFDEPMSGLDPLGRREVRELILRLRARGSTVFFSSHVLADAEALCSRVAILAGGRMVASGALADIRALDARGWDLVVHGLEPHALDALIRQGRVTRSTDIGGGRYALELPLSEEPHVLLADLAPGGVRLISAHPLRDSLEDFFVKQVSAAANDRGLEAR